MTAVNVFSGVGWDVAARDLGFDPIGIELDEEVCATRALHGMPTIRADVAEYPSEMFRGVEGFIASPPCPDFSAAGNRSGLDGETGHLTMQVLRWASVIRPKWVACEQVPAVLPIWRMVCHHLEALGYRTWCGVLHAEQHGVPQTRDRAILLAHYDRPVTPPEPTHQRYRSGEPARYEPASMFHGEILPWVSMAEARGWGDTTRPATCLVTPHGGGSGPIDGGSNSRRARLGRVVTGTFVLRTGNNSHVTNAGSKWCFDRPATTVACDERLPPAGHHDRQMDGAIKLTVPEALTLQSFPSDFELTGTKTARFRQVGNAVPPLLARRVLEQVIG